MISRSGAFECVDDDGAMFGCGGWWDGREVALLVSDMLSSLGIVLFGGGCGSTWNWLERRLPVAGSM